MEKLKAYIIPFLTVVFFSCKKESFIKDKDAPLAIAVDTLSFDTVFTSVGSITQNFTIVNPNSGKIKLKYDKVGRR